jgi:hypothetical protein
MKRFRILDRGFWFSYQSAIRESASKYPESPPTVLHSLELIIVIVILSVLAAAAIPMVRHDGEA